MTTPTQDEITGNTCKEEGCPHYGTPHSHTTQGEMDRQAFIDYCDANGITESASTLVYEGYKLGLKHQREASAKAVEGALRKAANICFKYAKGGLTGSLRVDGGKDYAQAIGHEIMALIPKPEKG